MSDIPDFTDHEMAAIQEAVNRRYGKHVEVQLADTELRLSPGSRQLTSCPTAYWEGRGAHFVVFKTGEDHYRCQFFYSVSKQYGTGIEEYRDLGECVTTLLRVQADHEAQGGEQP